MVYKHGDYCFACHKMFLFFIFSLISPLFFFKITLAEVVSVDITVDRKNFFDIEYKTFSKERTRVQLFGFNTNTVCRLEKHANEGWTVSLQSVNSLHRTLGTNIYLTSCYHPITCFEHNQHSFIFFGNNVTKEIEVFRGQYRKRVARLTEHGRIMFDHIAGRLFIINHNRISEIEMDYLEQWWTTKNQTEHSILKINIVSLLPEEKSDFIIIDSTVYVIQNRKIFKYPIDQFIGRDPTESFEFVTNSSDVVFNFLIFKPPEEQSVWLSMTGLPTILTKFWLYILYFFDVILVLVCAYALKQLRSYRKNGKKGSYLWNQYRFTPPSDFEMNFRNDFRNDFRKDLISKGSSSSKQSEQTQHLDPPNQKSTT